MDYQTKMPKFLLKLFLLLCFGLGQVTAEDPVQRAATEAPERVPVHMAPQHIARANQLLEGRIQLCPYYTF